MAVRRSILRGSRRLSAAVSSMLADALEKVETRKPLEPSDLAAQKAVNSSPSKVDWRAEKLHEELNDAKLAEAPTEPQLLLENEYPALRSLRTDHDVGDGLWICGHCRHENILRHWKGPHPFKFVCCNRCNRKISSDCYTTEILTPWANGLIHAFPPRPGHEVRYCQVCTTCGLSHRAEMVGMTLDFHGVSCDGCSSSSWGEDWLRFHMGSIEPYRRDPDASFVKLIDARVEHAQKVAFCRLSESDSYSSYSPSFCGPAWM